MSPGPFLHDAAHISTRLECKRLRCHLSREVGIKQVERGESLQCQTIIGQGCAKYCDSSVVSRSLLLFAKTKGWSKNNYWSVRHWLITIFCDNQVQWQYCFLIWSLFFLSTKDIKSLSDSLGKWSGIFTQERGFVEQNNNYYLQWNTYLKVLIYTSGGGLPTNEKEQKST